MKSKKVKVGFTLIELLITLAIIVITSLFVLPQIMLFWQRAVATSIENELQRTIDFARINALSSGETTRLCASRDGKTCSTGWQTRFILLAGKKVLYTSPRFSAQGVMHWRSFPHNSPFLDFSAEPGFIWQNGMFWYCVNRQVNPLWALAVNKVGGVKTLLSDSAGQIFDAKSKRVLCD